MNASEQLKRFPLTTVATAFAAGFVATSGLSGIGMTALSFVSKNHAVKRVALAAWPIVSSNLKQAAKDRVKDFVKEPFEAMRNSGAKAEQA